MARPLRIEFAGAIYHVTSRGDRKEPIFEDDLDRQNLLEVVAQSLGRYDAQMLAFCLMGNHYHFVIYTAQPNLSRLMRHINGVYTQRYNRRHAKTGHLFEGRFKAILVDRDAYLFEVCRYVELNPTRAGWVKDPADWPWSSYRAHIGAAAAPSWLDEDGLLGYVLGEAPATAQLRRLAQKRYQNLVDQAKGVELWPTGLRQQIYLGDEDFVERMQSMAPAQRIGAGEVPKAQRHGPRTFSDWLADSAGRDEAIFSACTRGGLTLTAVAKELGLSVSRVSRIVRGLGEAKGKT